MHAADLHIISNQDASDVLYHYPEWGRNLYAYEMAATGTESNRQGPCNCDSGGPLTILTESNEPVLIGTVKGGAPDCVGTNQDSPSVFVRVSHLIDWIQETITCPTVVNLIGTITNPILVTSDTTITSCGDINIEHVKVQSGAKLTLEAAGKVNLGVGFKVELGSKLEIK